MPLTLPRSRADRGPGDEHTERTRPLRNLVGGCHVEQGMTPTSRPRPVHPGAVPSRARFVPARAYSVPARAHNEAPATPTLELP